MESYYLIIVVCLILLAISDLVVGVSNDAVNFLNSALGSNAGTRKTIMIVATAGILLGAISSSGMMEIARKGIFNPEMFTFADIMVIFLAVMITDIILLDLFNTFGMPTSTTVSIMFELLGAAFAVACLKILSSNDSFSSLGEYLNTSNAVLIIAGIFLSVLIAFSIGMMVQYFVRMLFSFNLEKSMKKYGAIFGGIAITTITYFLLIKGMKGSSLIPEAMGLWIQENTVLLIAGFILFWISFSFVLQRLFQANILKIVVLSGTFSLAMAFAGNDLVNFIGVPLAGLQSYEIFQETGAAANELGMAVLGEKLQTNSLILLAAGVVMIVTLWFSKKARSVTETEINLARESVGSERFKPNFLARLIVKGGVRVGKIGDALISEKARTKIDARFTKRKESSQPVKDQPAFDMVRASVNLMVASVLIAFATSLKLPLSTTYVSFMVAMGTSLSDRAWNRDSAVYRVAGVVNVIAGWLFTALVAFTSAGILAVVLYYGGIVAVIGLMLVTAFLVIRSQVVHKKLEKTKVSSLNALMNRDHIKSTEVFKESEHRISTTLYKVSYILKDVITGLEREDRKVITKAKTELVRYKKEYEDLSASFYYYLKKIDSNSAQEGQFYLHVLNYLQNISQSIHLISEITFTHVRNMHKPIQEDKLEALKDLTDKMSNVFMKISELMGQDHKGSFQDIEDDSNKIYLLLNTLERQHLAKVKNEKSSPKNSMLYVSILLECRDILNDFTGLVGLYEKQDESLPVKPSGDKSYVMN